MQYIPLCNLYYCILGGNNAEYFRNRKSYFSLNVQAICDDDHKFSDIVARWPGSAHDSNIFNNSTIKTKFENEEFSNSIILGDSGYPLLPYLITPLLNPADQAQMLFNEAQIRTRNIIERTFGIWKRRFPILAYGMRIKIERVQDVIVTTAVLHNIARLMKEDQPPEVNDYPEEEELDAILYEGVPNNQGQDIRNALINNYFGNM